MCVLLTLWILLFKGSWNVCHADLEGNPQPYPHKRNQQYASDVSIFVTVCKYNKLKVVHGSVSLSALCLSILMQQMGFVYLCDSSYTHHLVPMWFKLGKTFSIVTLIASIFQAPPHCRQEWLGHRGSGLVESWSHSAGSGWGR